MITMDNIKLYYYKKQYQQSYQMLCFIASYNSPETNTRD